MDDARAIRFAGWAGAAGLSLVVVGIVSWAVATIDQSKSDATIVANARDSSTQVAAIVAYTVLVPGLTLLVWWATGLRAVLGRRSATDRLTTALVPGMTTFAALLLAGIALDQGSTIAASWTDRFTPDADTVRTLSVAGVLVAFAALAGAAVVVGVTTRIVQQARSVPAWVVWAGYATSALCLFGLMTYGVSMLVFLLWLGGAVAGVLRAAPSVAPAPGTPDVPAQQGPPTAATELRS